VQPARMETAEEGFAKLIESAGWGVFLIWFGVIFLAKLSWGVGLIGAGLIMLATQLTRAVFALHIHRFGLILGSLLVVAGIVRSMDIDLEKLFVPIWLIPALFIAAGLVVLVLALWRSPGD
jgi:hypothetical protein